MRQMQLARTCTVGIDPDTQWRVNVNSFQQDALITFRGWQYTSIYQRVSEIEGRYRKRVCVGRRHIAGLDSEWQILTFLDYEQVRDDGHNIISMGISGDGKIHIVFDAHNDPLYYRHSYAGIAMEPTKYHWDPTLFTPTLNSLRADEASSFKSLTYPRFLTLQDGDLLFELIGRRLLVSLYLSNSVVGSSRRP